MHPHTRAGLFTLTIDKVCDRLDLSARAAVALVERGLLGATLPRDVRLPTLADARFRADQLVDLLERAPKEVASLRGRYPRRTRDYDRALAFGALLRALDR